MFRVIAILIFFNILSYATKLELLLLQTYKDQNITSWVMSEKLDGIRAYWDGKNLISRGGKMIFTPKYFTDKLPPFELDGELWSKRNDFENISSIVRDKTPSSHWKEITYNIFEVPNAKGDLFDRLSKVKPYESKYLKIVKQINIKNKKHLEKFHNIILDKKGEGIVVRDPSQLYINKRTKYALKVKKFNDSECEVIGYTKGKGKFNGLVGAIKCKLENNILFKIGSGLSNEDRKNPPQIGDIITFKYQDFTKYGKPRFPVYLRVRYKKKEN